MGTFSLFIFNWQRLKFRSIFEKTIIPCNWSNRSSILGWGYLFLVDNLLRFWSIHNHTNLSLLTNRTGTPQGEKLGWINPLRAFFVAWVFNSINSIGAIWYGTFTIVWVSRIKLIVNSISMSSGSPVKSSENTMAPLFLTLPPIRGRWFYPWIKVDLSAFSWFRLTK